MESEIQQSSPEIMLYNSKIHGLENLTNSLPQRENDLSKQNSSTENLPLKKRNKASNLTEELKLEQEERNKQYQEAQELIKRAN